MKIKNLTLLTATGLCGIPAVAGAAAREDQSSLVIWAFLGFCALIVALQLLPAIHQWWLALRGSKENEAETQPVAETIRK